MFSSIRTYLSNPLIRSKIYWTIWLLALYRLLVFVPVPTADLSALMARTSLWWAASWLWYFSMLLWWSLDQFSIIALWLAPYINASIIVQLLWWVIPQLEQLQEQWEAGQKVLSQYTRWLSLPLSFLQGIGMTYFINYLLSQGWVNVINVANFWWVVIPTAFALTIGNVLLMWLADMITEKWLSNWTSLIIFASIVSWIVTQWWWLVSWATDKLWSFVFILIIVSILAILAILLIKTMKEIPVIYARQWKIQQTSTLPFPLNPVWMVPIIFAIAFASFPYLLSQLVIKFGSPSEFVANTARWIEANFNIYSSNPGWAAIIVYFLLIIFFTFFYTLIQFNPEKIADSVQKRGWYIPWLRPWSETVKYINGVLMHLCLWGWIGLWILWIYSYIINDLPFMQWLLQQFGSIPVIVTWSWVVIIIWVVQELINKLSSDVIMQKYEDQI